MWRGLEHSRQDLLHSGDGQGGAEGRGLGKFKALMWAARHRSATVRMPAPWAWGK